MLKSMTGFGRAEYKNDNITLEVEIKSLNSKNSDIKIRNNFLSSQNEIQIHNFLKQKLVRGKIDLFLTLKKLDNNGKYEINEQVFENYYSQIQKIAQKHGTTADKTDFYSIIMRLPEITEAKEFDITDIWENIFDTIKKATTNLDEFRTQEGKATKDALQQYINNIDDKLLKVPSFENERIETMREKILKAFDENNVKVDNEKLESELIFYLEKYDINEEKVRLANHLKYFVQTMKEESSGKKLGFITQEIGREINTLGSKANHFEIQKLVVQMKDDLEKIKEQILNIL